MIKSLLNQLTRVSRGDSVGANDECIIVGCDLRLYLCDLIVSDSVCFLFILISFHFSRQLVLAGFCFVNCCGFCNGSKLHPFSHIFPNFPSNFVQFCPTRTNSHQYCLDVFAGFFVLSCSEIPNNHSPAYMSGT